MNLWAFIRQLFLDEPPRMSLPEWCRKEGDSFIIDNPVAYAEYFRRLGYDASTPTVQQVGVARRWMLKDAMRLCEGKRIRFRGQAPTGVPGAFIDWSKEYERIGGKHG